MLTVEHKVVSKAEGRLRRLADVTPRERALALAATFKDTFKGSDPLKARQPTPEAEPAGFTGSDPVKKDARLVQVVLDESVEVLRAERGVIVSVTRHGFVCANAGVDASNAPEGEVVLLPLDPDASARRLRARIGELRGVRPAVIVTDSFGRAWRVGQTDVAIGAAGIVPVDDWRGRTDAHGRELRATAIAAADAIAGAADLARAKDSRQPAVVVSGLAHLVTEDDGPGAAALRRERDQDLFR